MKINPLRAVLVASIAAVLGIPDESLAVTLNADGLGQALIYPYYTARSVGGDAFNTYLSIVNHAGDAKALRVRFREGRNSREVLSFNLYLSPNDVWTGAVIPFDTGARLISADASCTDPPQIIESAFGPLPFMEFRGNAYSGVNADGSGEGLERTREGFVEVLEMATLSGASAAAVTHFNSVPANCAAIRASGLPGITAPTGGLSGTLTLINVATGMDFTVNAEALANLSVDPFFRTPSDPYPDFSAGEITATSLVVANAQAYRSDWSRPVDAVSAVLMRSAWLAEYVLDSSTRSLTDLVLTFPTRHFYAVATAALPPFTRPAGWTPDCSVTSSPALGERILFSFFDREERSAVAFCDFGTCPPPALDRICSASAVVSVSNGAAHMPFPSSTSFVLGSLTRGFARGSLPVTPTFQHGWIRLSAPDAASLTSLASSTRMDLATGRQVVGAHQFAGLPVVGLSAWTLQNGTLSCGAGSCQGNYGGAFPLKYLRTITPAS